MHMRKRWHRGGEEKEKNRREGEGNLGRGMEERKEEERSPEENGH